MDLQEVTIRLRKMTYVVDAVFHFFNTGSRTTEWVGFPRRGDVGDFVRFDAWLDGQKVDMSEERDRTSKLPKPHRWLVHRITFPHHAARTIRVSYEADYNSKDSQYLAAVYEYGTGADWRDVIGLAAFTIDGTEIGGIKNFSLNRLPPSARKMITENVIRFEMTDLKPSPHDELRVSFDLAKIAP